MEHPANTNDKTAYELSRMARQAATKLEQETRAEKAAASKVRKLEYEFGVTKTNGLAQVKSQTNHGQTPFHRSEKLNLLAGARHILPFSQAVVISRTLYSSDGLRSFTYKLEPIPKSAVSKRLKTGTKVGPGSAAKAVRYVAGSHDRGDYLTEDRTQFNHDGSTLFRSNIDPKNVEKCFEPFEAADRAERIAKRDLATINFARVPWLWRKVVDDPRCDPAVLAAYRKDPTGKVEIELCRGAAALREVLRSNDYRPKLTAKNQKIRDGYDGMKWRLSRGGRTQWRVVVSLPWEFDDSQRLEAMEQICELFANKGCMYFGVIHVPSATNSRKNAHCHIDLYDRPCRRLDGTAADLRNVPKKWRRQVIKEMRNGDFDKHHGKWDFEVSRSYRSSSGNKLSHKIFRAPKSIAMREYSLPKESRKDISGIINGIANRDFDRALYDHRDYEKMTIDKRPDRPLGPYSHAMEGKGGSSEIGSHNEDNHAEFGRAAIIRNHQRRHDELRLMRFDLSARTMGNILHGVRLEARDEALSAIRSAQILAELERDAALLQLEIRRKLSSAYNVIRTSNRTIRLGADVDGKRKKLRDDARKYWRQWVADNAEQVDLLKSMKVTIAAFAKAPSIDRLIALASVPLTKTEIDTAEERLKEMTRRNSAIEAVPSNPQGAVDFNATNHSERSERAGDPRACTDLRSEPVVAIIRPLVRKLGEFENAQGKFSALADSSETMKEGAVLAAVPRSMPINAAPKLSVDRPSESSTRQRGSTLQGQAQPLSVDLQKETKVSAGKRNIMTKAGAFSQTSSHDQTRSKVANPTGESPVDSVSEVIPSGRIQLAAKGEKASLAAATPSSATVSEAAIAAQEADLTAPRLALPQDEKQAPGTFETRSADAARLEQDGINLRVKVDYVHKGPSSAQATDRLQGLPPLSSYLAHVLAQPPSPEINAPLAPNPTPVKGQSVRKRELSRTDVLMENSNTLKVAAAPFNRNGTTPDDGKVTEKRDPEFEREMLLHVVRTRRIRLVCEKGVWLLPTHRLLPQNWRCHAPGLQFELGRDQQAIEGELRALMSMIAKEDHVPSQDSPFKRMLETVFEDQQMVIEAKAKRNRERHAANAQRSAAASQQGQGIS